MELEQFVQIDVSQTVSVGREERRSKIRLAASNPFPGIAGRSRIHHGDVPLRKTTIEVIVENLLPPAGRQNEVAETLSLIKPHEVNQDGCAPNRHHDFWIIFCEWIRPRPFATTEDHDLHFTIPPLELSES